VAKRTSAETRYREILSKRRDGEAYCALADRMGVKRRTLYYWLQRLRKQERRRAQLVPVELPSLTGLDPLAATAIEVSLRGSGHVLRVPPRFDATSLRALIDVLERR